MRALLVLAAAMMASYADAFMHLVGSPYHHAGRLSTFAQNVNKAKNSVSKTLRRTMPVGLRMADEKVDCLVLGGGVSGMTAAFYLSKEQGTSVILAEKGANLGGVISTRVEDGYMWEEGPNTFQPADAMLKLIADAGLGGEVVPTDPKLARYVYYNDDLFSLPSSGGPPKDIFRLLTPFALVRAFVGGILPVAPTAQDETVAQFFDRTLGPEILEKLVDPFIGTVYTGDPQKMSFQSVFPAIKKIADKADSFGGLAKSFISSRKEARKNAPSPPANLPNVPKGSSASFRGGLQALPQKLQQTLGSACRTGWHATSITQDAEGFTTSFDTPQGTKQVSSRSLIVSTPSKTAADLLADLSPQAKNLANIRGPPVWAVTLSYPDTAFNPTRAFTQEQGGVSGFGVLIPRSCGIPTLGFQFISSLFPGRSPAGVQTVLAYYGGAKNDAAGTMAQEEVVAAVHADACKVLLGPNPPQPKVLSVRLWSSAIPQYNIGHKEILDGVRSELPQGVVLGGSFVGGVSVGDCVSNSVASANEILAFLK